MLLAVVCVREWLYESTALLGSRADTWISTDTPSKLDARHRLSHHCGGAIASKASEKGIKSRNQHGWSAFAVSVFPSVSVELHLWLRIA